MSLIDSIFSVYFYASLPTPLLFLPLITDFSIMTCISTSLSYPNFSHDCKRRRNKKSCKILSDNQLWVSKIFGGLNFRGQFRGLNFEGHFRGINPKRNRWHSSVSFSIMFYWLCFCEGGNHGSFLSI